MRMTDDEGRAGSAAGPADPPPPPKNFPPAPLVNADAAAATVGIDTETVEAVAGQSRRTGRICAWAW